MLASPHRLNSPPFRPTRSFCTSLGLFTLCQSDSGLVLFHTPAPHYNLVPSLRSHFSAPSTVSAYFHLVACRTPSSRHLTRPWPSCLNLHIRASSLTHSPDLSYTTTCLNTPTDTSHSLPTRVLILLSVLLDMVLSTLLTRAPVFRLNHTPAAFSIRPLYRFYCFVCAFASASSRRSNTNLGHSPLPNPCVESPPNTFQTVGSLLWLRLKQRVSPLKTLDDTNFRLRSKHFLNRIQQGCSQFFHRHYSIKHLGISINFNQIVSNYAVQQQ